MSYRNEIARTVCKESLKSLEDEGFKGISAGGFPRDYILGQKYDFHREVNDIDIYLHFSPELELFLEKTDMRKSNQYKDSMNGLKSVFTANKNNKKGLFGKSENFEIQLILVETDKDLKDYVFSEFDLSICEVAFDGTTFFESPRFKDTMVTKEVTLNQNLGQLALVHSVKKHMRKMADKFGKEFKFTFTNKKFTGHYFNAKAIARNKLSEKLIESENKWLLKTEKYYIIDEYSSDRDVFIREI